MTHTDAVYNFMKRYGGITSMQAFKEIGDTRLSGTIFQLKKRLLASGKEYIDSETIEVSTREGKTTRVSNYFLRKKNGQRIKGVRA